MSIKFDLSVIYFTAHEQPIILGLLCKCGHKVHEHSHNTWWETMDDGKGHVIVNQCDSCKSCDKFRINNGID